MPDTGTFYVAINPEGHVWVALDFDAGSLPAHSIVAQGNTTAVEKFQELSAGHGAKTNSVRHPLTIGKLSVAFGAKTWPTKLSQGFARVCAPISLSDTTLNDAKPIRMDLVEELALATAFLLAGGKQLTEIFVALARHATNPREVHNLVANTAKVKGNIEAVTLLQDIEEVMAQQGDAPRPPRPRILTVSQGNGMLAWFCGYR